MHTAFMVGFTERASRWDAKQLIIGIFVSKNQPKRHEFGNFVSKNNGFGLFLALAKNLTMWSRPNERTDAKS